MIQTAEAMDKTIVARLFFAKDQFQLAPIKRGVHCSSITTTCVGKTSRRTPCAFGFERQLTTYYFDIFNFISEIIHVKFIVNLNAQG
jgi:hypothetical protein